MNFIHSFYNTIQWMTSNEKKKKPIDFFEKKRLPEINRCRTDMYEKKILILENVIIVLHNFLWKCWLRWNFIPLLVFSFPLYIIDKDRDKFYCQKKTSIPRWWWWISNFIIVNTSTTTITNYICQQKFNVQLNLPWIYVNICIFFRRDKYKNRL